MLEPRQVDDVFEDIIEDTASLVKWNRKQAMKMLDKANDIEARAAEVANKYREAAAALVMEAQRYADDQADVLAAEFPMFGPEESDEVDEDE